VHSPRAGDFCLMTPNDASRWPGRNLPADHQQQPGTARPLVLELIIAGTEPLTGTIRTAGRGAPVAFHGWIDLMAAVSSLGAGCRAEPARPNGDLGRSRP
jgi:hypothetical protein